MLVKETKPDESITYTSYDNAYRITEKRTIGCHGTLISGFAYTYDLLGKIVTEYDLVTGSNTWYEYDELSRVTKRTVNGVEQKFSYDSAGNVLNNNCHYDDYNKLTSQNGVTINYDADGNMLCANLDGQLTAFAYDSSNRLISAGDCEYTYNAEDVRIKSKCGDKETFYVYDTNAKLSKLLVKKTNGVYTKYVYGNGLIYEQSCDKSACEFKAYHFDYRGSTVAITNYWGFITDRFKYDTYGKVTQHIGYNKDIIFTYNGRDGVVTEPNGLYYMRARYYSPDLMRFIHADIVSGSISNAITLNRYAYANGNPVSNIDPFGLSAERGDNNALAKLLSYIGFDKEKFYDDFNNLTGIDIAGEILINDDLLAAFHKSLKNYLKAAKRPKGMGKREWNRLINEAKNQTDDLYGPTSKLAKGLKAAPYIAVGIDSLLGVIENLQNGEDTKEIITDAAIDIGIGAGSAFLSSLISGAVTGAISGSVAPGVGNLIGLGVGAIVGIGTYVATEVVKIDGKSAVEWLDSLI